LKAQAIDKESLLDLLEPPMKQLLKERLAKREAAQAGQQKPAPQIKEKKGGQASESHSEG